MVDCTGLENRRLERVREFESHRFRQRLRKYVLYRTFFVSTYPKTYPRVLAALGSLPSVRVFGCCPFGSRCDLFATAVLDVLSAQTPPYPHPPLFELVPYRSYVITIPDERCDAAPNRMSVVGLFDGLLTDSVLIQIASMLPHKPLHSHSQPVARVKDRQVPQAISLGTKSSQTDSTSYSPVCNLGAKFWWCLFPTCTKRPAPQMR